MTTKSEVMKRVERGEVREMSTHTVFGNFDVTATRRLIKIFDLKPHVGLFSELRSQNNSGGDDIVGWLVSQREVDLARAAELTVDQLNDPIIDGIDDNGFAYIIDGIHRLFERHRRGLPDFYYYAIPMNLIPRPICKIVDVPWGTMDVLDGKLVDRRTKK